MKAKQLLQSFAILILLLAILFPFPANAAPVVLYAKPAGLASGACDSWANACDLQYALTSAVSGQEIWVTAGVYKPTTSSTDRAATFQLKNGVGLYGGFMGIETMRDERSWETNQTILSGDIDNNDTNIDANFIAEKSADIQGENTYHVVGCSYLDNTAVLDGFIITAGQANVSGNSNGGGMYNEDHSSPVLRNIVFSGNAASNTADLPGYGGGLYNNQYSNASLMNVSFLGNSAALGGGMYNGNTSHAALMHVTFSTNQAAGGGGMFNASDSNPTLTSVLFYRNSSSWYGGGLQNDSGSPILTNVTFFGNTAANGGGGAISTDDTTYINDPPTLSNSILWGNTAKHSPTIYYPDPWRAPVINYSDIQGGWSGTGNISADPRFVDPVGGDLHLIVGSPAIDSGSNDTCAPADRDGIPRPQEGNGDGTPTCDIGAYEYYDFTPPTVLSIVRAGSNPTSSSLVHFKVSFSESMVNVGADDFSLATTGVTSAAITNVSGSGATYTVSVTTGTGNGKIRLDVPVSDTAQDLGGNSLAGLPYRGGQTYTIIKTHSFADVATTHPYYYDIEILYANGLTGGCSMAPMKYCPDQTMNRGEAAVFILRANFGSSYVSPVPTHVFQDDWTKGPWAETWAEGMYYGGLSAGCQASPPKYCPWDLIPREQAVIFALRMKYGMTYTPPPATGTLFVDMTDTSYYATSWAEKAYKDGLIPNCGMSGGKPKFCPKDLVSRGLAAYMIVRAKGLTMP